MCLRPTLRYLLQYDVQNLLATSHKLGFAGDAGYIQLCLRDSRLPFISTLLTLNFVYERLLITNLNLFQRSYY